MFKHLEAAPPDAILGLNEAFGKDPSSDKINLTTGVYKDADGQTTVLDCVKEAERWLLDNESTKSYLGIDGMPGFGERVRDLLLGEDHEINTSRRAATIQSPGGTGALRVAGEFLARTFPEARIWCSRPTWANHGAIFRAAGIEVAEYSYFDAASNSLDLSAFLDDLAQIPPGDIVCLHGCCHNPTGVDPSPEQWQQVAEIVSERGLLPLVDFAYQGFGDGLDSDTTGLQALSQPGCQLLIASSFSKNFGLYRERVGALTVTTSDSDTADIVLSVLKQTIRANYSNPPSHGAAIVTTILDDQSLRQQWEDELALMRTRINTMRRRFVEEMSLAAPDHDFRFVTAQRGMFSFSGLSTEQVDRLREDHAVYMVRNGRINVAGLTETNVAPFCQSIAKVL